MNPLSQAKIPTNKSLWIVLVIIILIIAGYGVYAYISKNVKNSNVVITTSTNTTFNTNSAINANIDTSEWKTYENDELGLSFKYPPELGDVLFKIAAGTTGQRFKGAFSQSDAIVFGGTTTDYSFPSEVGFTDTYGYIQKDNEYFMYLPTASREHQVSLLNKLSNSTVDGIIYSTKMYDMERKGAVFNLANDTFHGIGFLLKDDQEVNFSIFEEIMYTFSATHANIDTSRWKKHTSHETYVTENWRGFHIDNNREISYSIQYPNNWTLGDTVFEDENGNKIAEFSPGAVYLKEGQGCENQPLPNDNEEAVTEELSRSNITIGNYHGVKIITKVRTQIGDSRALSYWYPNRYCIQEGNKAFIMNFYETELGKGDRALFEKLLSTIQFVDTNAEGKTYENTKLNFSLNYSPAWTAQTVESDTVIDHQIGDAILSDGDCGAQCNISRDFCNFTIAKATTAAEDKIKDPIKWIKGLGSYKGDPISEVQFNGNKSYVTKAAVTPPAQDGSQLVGLFILIYNSKIDDYYKAYLSAGFLDVSCENNMKQIIDTITFK